MAHDLTGRLLSPDEKSGRMLRLVQEAVAVVKDQMCQSEGECFINHLQSCQL